MYPTAPRRESGYRDYSATDVHRLRFIANARDLGFPIGEIASLPSLWSNADRESAEVKRLALARADALGRKVIGLEAMRATLVDLAELGAERPECPVIDNLEGNVLPAS